MDISDTTDFGLPPARNYDRPILSKNHQNSESQDRKEHHDHECFKGTIKDSFDELSRHTCSPNCLLTNPKFSELKEIVKTKNVPVLTLSTLLGWQRLIIDDKIGHHSTKVRYVSPCQKPLLNFHDLHEYLMVTGCHLPINFFSYSANVNIRNIFSPNFATPVIKDITEGNEFLPISVINVVDTNSKTDSLAQKYIKDFTYDKNVMRNDDPNFLVCCNCPDDCKDKLKCPCFQMTLQNCDPQTKATYSYIEIGYRDKLLHRHLLSGIFECNRMCKCRETCLNRVIQHDMMFQLQLFKTPNKGWGLRTLHDIPKGSYVCKYVGNMITSQKAAKIVDEGWKYLANLRIAQPFKEGYECEAVEPVQRRFRRSSIDKHLKSFGKCGKQIKKSFGKVGETISTLPQNDIQNNSSINRIIESVIKVSKYVSKSSKRSSKEIVVEEVEPTENYSQFSNERTKIPENTATFRRIPKVIKITENSTNYVDSIKSPKKHTIEVPISPDSGFFSSPAESVKSYCDTDPAVIWKKSPPSITMDVECNYQERVYSHWSKCRLEGSPLKFESHIEMKRRFYDNYGPFLQVGSIPKVKRRNNVLLDSLAKLDMHPTVISESMTENPEEELISVVGLTDDIPKIEIKNGNPEEEIISIVGQTDAPKAETSENPEEEKISIVGLTDTPKRSSVLCHKRLNESPDVTTPISFTSNSFSPDTDFTPCEAKNNNVITPLSIPKPRKSKSSRGSGCSLFNAPQKLNNLKQKRKRLKNRQKQLQGKDSTNAKYNLRELKANYTPVTKKNGRQARSFTKIGKYVVDAKIEGNIGRYINHSCDPNLFPQHVFTEIQDLNFPTLALFANKDIKAGSELTWDYNYDLSKCRTVASITCHCGSDICRERLC